MGERLLGLVCRASGEGRLGLRPALGHCAGCGWRGACTFSDGGGVALAVGGGCGQRLGSGGDLAACVALCGGAGVVALLAASHVVEGGVFDLSPSALVWLI